MARYTNVIGTIFSAQEINQIVADTLTGFKFKHKCYQGEDVWQNGGAFAAPQFIKITAKNGTAIIEAWLKYSILPGIYCGEMDLTDTLEFALKDVLRKSVAKLEGNIKRD